MFGILHDHCGAALGAIAFFVFVLGFTGAPLFLWTAVAAIFLYGFGVGQTCWIVFAVIAVVLNVAPIRAMLISAGVLKLFQAMKLVPAISETERVAIEAGVVWVEKELFSGKPNFKMMMSEPYPSLTAEEQAFIDGPTEKLCSLIDDWRIWQDREISSEVMDFIKKERFFGMIIPKKYGGLEFSALCHSEVVKKVSSRSLAAGITVMVPNSLGPAELLNHYGTQAQKDKYLKRLANGDEVPCFALTEPNAGSDAGSITSSGELFKGDDGKLYIKLNWEKRWITLAAISTLLGLAFRLRDPKNLLGKGEDLGITCALVPSNTPGVVLGLRHDPLGVPFYNCPTRGKDVVVNAEDAIIGGLEGAGKGWGMLMECLGAGRGISLPAQSTGGTQQCALVASAHAAVRKQFGIPVGSFEGVEELLARIASSAYLLEASRRYTCGAIDKGIKPPVVTAIAKYQSTEISRRAVIDAMDILGGAGISRGPKNVLSSGYIAMPIGITVEGANVMTRTLIIFGQGALRAHPWAFQEVKAVEANNVRDFDRAFFGHVGHVVRNLFRSVGLSVTRGWLACAPSGVGPVKHYYRKLSWASASFAIMADIAMGMLGGELKIREQLTGRFADILSYMYLGTAVLRRWDAEGRRQEDLPYVHFCMETCFMNIQRGFDGIFQNFRPAGLTWFFRGVLGTWSMLNRFTAGPNDKLTHRVAVLAQTPGEQRTRFFSEGNYLPKDSSKDQIALLEEAFRASKAAEATERKVKKAVRAKQLPKIKGAKLYEEALAKNVINKAEFDMLEHSEKLRWRAIQVDEFTLEQYKNRA
ncbi:MAG: acyl-CoA dehydrogenase [Bacteriovoracia bacterium]